MSAESIIKKIMKTADEEASAILEQATAKADNILAEKVAEAEKRASEILANATAQQERIINAAQLSSSLNASINLLNTKQKILKEAALRAENMIPALDEVAWIKLYTKLIEASAPSGSFKVVAPASLSKRAAVAIESWNKKFSNASFELSDNSAVTDKEFYLCGENYDIDLSCAVIIGEILEKDEKASAECLFN